MGQDFNQLAKEKFAELEKEEAELKAKLASIQQQKGPLKTFMKSAGLIEFKKRGPRKKKVSVE